MQSFYKTLVTLLLGFLQSLCLAADSGKPIRIGVSIGLTGKYTEIGRIQKFAYQLWEAQVNDRGGILGRQVRVIVQDDKSDPQVAVETYKQFIETEKVDFVFGPYSSPITEAVAPLTEKASYPMLAAGASSNDLWTKGYQYLFGVMSPAKRDTIGFFALLSQSKLQRVGIVSKDDSFSLSVTEGAKQWAAQYGCHIIAYQVLSKTEPDFVGAAQVMRDKGAEIVILGGFYEDSVKMRQAFKQISWNPSAYYAASGPALSKFYQVLGPDAEKAFTMSNWEPREDLRLPGSIEFLKAYRARYNETPAYQSATAYAAGQILEKAILKAGSLDRVAVRQALSTMTMDTIIGHYAVDGTGMLLKRPPLIVQWQNSKLEIVWPEEMRTSKPVFNNN